MKKRVLGLAIALFVLVSFSAQAGQRKVQEVNFDGADVQGTVRNPDGAYLVQKRGIDFVPLYKVKDQFDNSIKESIEYLR